MIKKIILIVITINSFNYCQEPSVEQIRESYKPGGKNYCEMFIQKAKPRLEEIAKEFEQEKYRKCQLYKSFSIDDLYAIKADAELCGCEDIIHMVNDLLATLPDKRECEILDARHNARMDAETHIINTMHAMKVAREERRKERLKEEQELGQKGLPVPFCESCEI